MIAFELDNDSPVPKYAQLVQQVRQAIRLGALQHGERLPPVRKVVDNLHINPNTVLRAYQELQLEGLTSGRRGVGTFVTASPTTARTDQLTRLRSSLEQWIDRARAAGVNDETIAALFATARRNSGQLSENRQP